MVFHETGLHRILKSYFKYYESCRTHLSVEKDAPVSRPVEPPTIGQVIAIPQVGGLHHLYTRKLPAEGPFDESFRVGILPRTLRCSQDFTDAHPLGCLTKLVCITAIRGRAGGTVALLVRPACCKYT